VNIKPLDKKEIQLIWDKCLIGGWYADVSVVTAMEHFWSSVADGPSDFCPVEVARYMADSGVRRFNGRGYSIRFGQPVRGLVDARCSKLSRHLWSGASTQDEVVENIRSFKWVLPARKKVKSKSGGANLRVKVRENDKRADWKTVK